MFGKNTCTLPNTLICAIIMANRLKRFKELLLDLLRQGKSKKELSIAITIGVLLGVFPVLGVTTIICVFLGRVFKLNVPTLLASNYIVFPIQVFMIYGLIKMGETLFFLENSIDYEFFKTLMEQSLGTIFRTLGTSLLAAVASWILVAAVLCLPLYHLFFFLLGRFSFSESP